jgi:hypothetical protein
MFKELNDTDLNHLAYLVNSPAYLEFFEPYLQAMERGLLNDLISPASERKNEKPDDYLRGGIMVIRAILEAPRWVLEREAERLRQEAEIKNDVQFYDERAQAGSYGPLPVQEMGNEEQTNV